MEKGKFYFGAMQIIRVLLFILTPLHYAARHGYTNVMKIPAKLGIYDLPKRFSIDLSPLEKRSNLQTLDLTRIQISDLESIKELINLKISK